MELMANNKQEVDRLVQLSHGMSKMKGDVVHSLFQSSTNHSEVSSLRCIPRIHLLSGFEKDRIR